MVPCRPRVSTSTATIAHCSRNSNIIVDAACSLDTNSSSSYSKRPDTFDSGSTNSAAPASASTTARKNEHEQERERAHTPPFDASLNCRSSIQPYLQDP